MLGILRDLKTLSVILAEGDERLKKIVDRALKYLLVLSVAMLVVSVSYTGDTGTSATSFVFGTAPFVALFFVGGAALLYTIFTRPVSFSRASIRRRILTAKNFVVVWATTYHKEIGLAVLGVIVSGILIFGTVLFFLNMSTGEGKSVRLQRGFIAEGVVLVIFEVAVGWIIATGRSPLKISRNYEFNFFPTEEDVPIPQISAARAQRE